MRECSEFEPCMCHWSTYSLSCCWQAPRVALHWPCVCMHLACAGYQTVLIPRQTGHGQHETNRHTKRSPDPLLLTNTQRQPTIKGYAVFGDLMRARAYNYKDVLQCRGLQKPHAWECVLLTGSDLRESWTHYIAYTTSCVS